MKKNISINLQGIIFHIEEDGYEQLGSYLASIRTYFSNYEGHEEIIADIEARIAEIFASRLSPGKQVITLEDVQKLISQMGNVTDFEQEEPVLEEYEYRQTASSSAAGAGAGPIPGTGDGTDHDTNTGTGYQEPEPAPAPGPKKLYRDVSQKVISGVSAGIANYLGIDPLWIRLILVLLLVMAPFTAGLSIAFVLAGYIILWNSLPVNYTIHESKIKKLFRDPLDKKLGGVASGIAKFFGLDVTIVRILFLASFLVGGVGLVLYIILWIAVPEAVTLTERMQMQGSPVTISGIEQTLKENLRFKDENGEETETAKVLLLPLRLLSQVLTWLGRVLGSVLGALVTLIRISAGIFLLCTSIALIFGLCISLLIALGVLDDQTIFWSSDIPVQAFLVGFPLSGIVAGFVAGLIPSLLLLVLAISLLAKRFFLSPIVGWSMFGVWLVSVFILGASVAMFAQHFRRTAEFETTRILPVENYKTITLDAAEIKNPFGRISLDVQSHSGSTLDLRQLVRAKGRTEEEAKQNAQMVTYQVEVRDSVLRFDGNYEFKDGAAYRDQGMGLTLQVPENKQFRLTRRFIQLASDSNFEGNYSREKMVRNLWQVQGDKFVCTTCATDTLGSKTNTSQIINQTESEAVTMAGSVLMSDEDYSSDIRNYNLKGFNRVTANGPYHLQLTQGKTFSISVRGNEEAISKLRISKNGNQLEIEPRHNFSNSFTTQNPLLIQVTMPELRALELTGAIKADVQGFKEENFDLSLAGAINSNINVEARTMKVEMSGLSHSTMAGNTEKLILDMAGAGSFDAAHLKARNVKADVSGVCNADVFATHFLRADATGASNIRFKGNPTDVKTDVTGASTINQF